MCAWWRPGRVPNARPNRGSNAYLDREDFEPCGHLLLPLPHRRALITVLVDQRGSLSVHLAVEGGGAEEVGAQLLLA